MKPKNRPRLSWKELALISLPLLLLMTVAYIRRDRGPFHMVVDEAQLTMLRPHNTESVQWKWSPHTRAVKVKVFVRPEGNLPAWWGDGMNMDSRVHFTAKNEKDDGSNVGGYDCPQYDKASGRYFFNYWGEIPEKPDFLKGATCQIWLTLRSQIPPEHSLAGVKTSRPTSQMTH